MRLGEDFMLGKIHKVNPSVVFAYANEGSDLFSGGHILLGFSSNGEGLIVKFILSPA